MRPHLCHCILFRLCWQDDDSSDDDDDDTAELLAELNKIKKERAQEQEQKVQTIVAWCRSRLFIFTQNKMLSVYMSCYTVSICESRLWEKISTNVMYKYYKIMYHVGEREKSGGGENTNGEHHQG